MFQITGSENLDPTLDVLPPRRPDLELANSPTSAFRIDPVESWPAEWARPLPPGLARSWGRLSSYREFLFATPTWTSGQRDNVVAVDWHVRASGIQLHRSG
jgi:hypothetical protein